MGAIHICCILPDYITNEILIEDQDTKLEI